MIGTVKRKKNKDNISKKTFFFVKALEIGANCEKHIKRKKQPGRGRKKKDVFFSFQYLFKRKKLMVFFSEIVSSEDVAEKT